MFRLNYAMFMSWPTSHSVFVFVFVTWLPATIPFSDLTRSMKTNFTHFRKHTQVWSAQSHNIRQSSIITQASIEWRQFIKLSVPSFDKHKLHKTRGRYSQNCSAYLTLCLSEKQPTWLATCKPFYKQIIYIIIRTWVMRYGIPNQFINKRQRSTNPYAIAGKD